MDEKLRFPNNMSYLTQDRQHRIAKTQWRAIVCTAVLLLGGSVLLVLGSMIVTGHLDPDTHGERFWPLVLLGGECSYLFLVLTMSTLHTKPSQETQTRALTS